MNCAASDLLVPSLVALAYMGLEYWLGKTAKTRSGSVLELLIVAVTLLTVYLRSKYDERRNRKTEGGS